MFLQHFGGIVSHLKNVFGNALDHKFQYITWTVERIIQITIDCINMSMTEEEFIEIRLNLGLNRELLAYRMGLGLQDLKEIETNTGPSLTQAMHLRLILKQKLEFLDRLKINHEACRNKH